jgi:putative SOS response-associated peptidase YedK
MIADASSRRHRFAIYADTKPRKTPTWFALSQDRPLLAFAGLWTPLARRTRPEERPGGGQT